jgi:hypothetical protein
MPDDHRPHLEESALRIPSLSWLALLTRASSERLHNLRLAASCLSTWPAMRSCVAVRHESSRCIFKPFASAGRYHKQFSAVEAGVTEFVILPLSIGCLDACLFRRAPSKEKSDLEYFCIGGARKLALGCRCLLRYPVR